MDYQIETIYCHTGSQQMNDYASRTIEELLNNTNIAGAMELLTFSEIKLQELYEFFANGQRGDNITIEDVVLTNWGVVEAPFKAFYGTISASAIGEWYDTHGNNLFAKNIRYYKGSTSVNQGIRNVLKDEPQNFFWSYVKI